jgi:hypothetical protein
METHSNPSRIYTRFGAHFAQGVRFAKQLQIVPNLGHVGANYMIAISELKASCMRLSVNENDKDPKN